MDSKQEMNNFPKQILAIVINGVCAAYMIILSYDANAQNDQTLFLQMMILSFIPLISMFRAGRKVIDHLRRKKLA